MKRHKLINKIIKLSSDELESDDYIQLAKESKKQLMNRIIHINNYLINNKL